jgi:hypothetical protein
MAAINLNASTPTMVDLSSSAAAEFDPDQLFTCLSCSVAFLSPDEQREHMRSDWHRYNMKVRNLSIYSASLSYQPEQES